MNNTARGTFEIQATRQPPYDGADGVVLARTHFDKQFSGDLVATSTVEATSSRSSREASSRHTSSTSPTSSPSPAC